ncbi:hypothetical protein AUC71_03060 [Methyloceanibacter marginalis]|uniref:Uncharacterized protein n=1 Tax=Methyloceanibacter marginalis TaxID=1774971 RepID=A0A1E3W954_9HYPH|nr:hypothetical protein AUC71_03060 [Methyloceanibacter marginalis]
MVLAALPDLVVSPWSAAGEAFLVNGDGKAFAGASGRALARIRTVSVMNNACAARIGYSLLVTLWGG